MKLLNLIHTQGHGGAENTFRWLAWSLRQEGIEVVAAIPAAKDPKQENWITPALEELGIPHIPFDVSGNSMQLLKNISSTIDLIEPDLVHSHLLDSNFYSSLACRLKGIPHVCTEHGDVSLGLDVSARIKYGLISICSRNIVCVSEAVKERASRVVPFRRKLKTIYNGIRFFENTPSHFREEFGVPANAVLVGNVGNLYPVKGQRFLLRAFAGFLEFCPGAYLAFVGRGAEEEKLRAQVRHLNIPQERVLFAGFRGDVEKIMNAFDLYVQSSLSEGHPIALLEAMSLGIPVIATSVGGVPEVVGPDRYGSLVKCASSEDILRAMRIYLEHTEVFRERALLAKSHVRSTYSLQTMARNYMDLYRQALAGRGRRH